MIKLSKRLKAAADLVVRGAKLADIGTDHGWVPIYLVQTGAIPSALAMDIRRGPLDRACGHIKEYGLEERIECRLSDGLETYTKGECESILIAGMGGELITRILKDGHQKLTEGMQLILSPHTHAETVRGYLHTNGFIVKDELCVYDEGKYYFLMDVRAANVDAKDVLSTQMNTADAYRYIVSDILVRKRDAVYRDYLRLQAAKHERIMSRVQDKERGAQLAELAGIYREAAKYIDTGAEDDS